MRWRCGFLRTEDGDDNDGTGERAKGRTDGRRTTTTVGRRTEEDDDDGTDDGTDRRAEDADDGTDERDGRTEMFNLCICIYIYI